MINPWNSEGNLVNLDSYPKLSEYYQTNFDALSSRHIVKKNSSQWYRTIDKIYADLQTRPKLLFSDLSSRSDPIYDHGRFYPHHNLYWCTSDSWNLEALGGFFLSSQVESIIDAYGVKMRGKTMRFQAQYLRMIHLPYPDRIDEGNLNELKRAFLNRNRDMASEIVSYIISEA